jgi:hypothetical protein
VDQGVVVAVAVGKITVGVSSSSDRPSSLGTGVMVEVAVGCISVVKAVAAVAVVAVFVTGV